MGKVGVACIFMCALIICVWGRSYGIVKAFYGSTDVTAIIFQQVLNQASQFTADNTLLGDTWSGNVKTLVVAIQCGGSEPRLYFTRENTVFTFPIDGGLPKLKSQNGTYVYGAIFGVTDVTSVVQNLVDAGATSVTASTSTFGDSIPGFTSTLTVLYTRNNENVQVKCVRAGSIITF